MESPRKEVVGEAVGDDESSESEVLQCSGAGDNVVSGSVDVLTIRVWDRSLGAGKMANLENESDYWRSGVRKGRCRARKSFRKGPFGVNQIFVVDRTSIKRKHEEVQECCPVPEAREHCEDTDSDDWASSSDSDTSDSEAEQGTKRETNSKRKKCGEDMRASLQPKFGLLKKPVSNRPISMAQGSICLRDDEETMDCDKEMKEMQELIELQLQASEKREGVMKKHMEMMIDMLSRHMGHVEKRVSNLEEGAHPQEQVLQRINVKLEKVMDGFTALNENLEILSACLSKNLESQ